jgi:Tfp pilus assembly protein PilE
MERAIAIIVILAALVLIGFSLFGPKSQNPGAAQKEAHFTLTKNAITPERVYVQHGRVKIVITNKDTILHEIEIYDPVEKRVIAETDLIRIGATKTLWVDLTGGRRYEIYDPIWRKKGMEGLIITR